MKNFINYLLENKIPSKYLTRKPKEIKKEIEKYRGKDKYKKNWEADYDKRTNKRIKTEKSKSTKEYEKKFKKIEHLQNFENFKNLINKTNESVDTKGSNSNNILKKKSKESGISLTILKEVYKRGMAAWNSGHRPGVVQQQWAIGRVNSFITGVGGARKSDSDLWKKAKEQKNNKKESIGWIIEESETDIINLNLNESESSVKKVKDGIIYRGERFPGYNKPKTYNGKKKFKKRVLAKEGDKIKILNYGHKDYSDYTKHKDTDRRRNFRARHKCDPVSKLSKLTKKYWACQDLW